MTEKNITFEDLPKAMTWMMDKLNELTSKADNLNNQTAQPQTNQWMNLKELCEYLPNHPAEQTVYGWTSCHLIPFHKRGKRIMFLNQRLKHGCMTVRLNRKRNWRQKLLCSSNQNVTTDSNGCT